MALSPQNIVKLKKLIELAQSVLSEAESGAKLAKGAPKAPPTSSRKRRTGKELIAFRKSLKAERKKGVSVTELSKKYDISSAYIYGLD